MKCYWQALWIAACLTTGCHTAPKYASVREAITAGDTRRLRQTLDADPRLVNTRQPLSIAAQQKKLAAVQLLIERGADVDAIGSFGGRPLDVAAACGSVPIVRLLLARGANVNATNYNCETPLYAAARNDHIGVARLLLQSGANPHIRSTNTGESPLALAAENGNATMTALLLAAGEPANATNSCRDTVLHLAAKKGNMETVALLLAHGAAPNRHNYDGATPLHVVAGQGRRDLVRLLISKGADVNSRDGNELTPLHWAASAEQYAAARYLLAQGAQDDIWSASMLGHAARVRQLLTNNRALATERDGWGLTALHRAAEYGHQTIVEALLATGADINAASRDSATPLTTAVAAGHYSLAEYLISKGANPRGNEDWTPLHSAASNGRTDTIQLLLRLGADVNAASSYGGITPLHIAAERGHAQAAELLLKHGAKVNARQHDGGKTPLHLAVGKHHRWNRTVEVLLHAGADVRAQTTGLHSGQTPLLDAVGNLHAIQLMLTGGTGLRLTDPEMTEVLFRANRRSDPRVALWLLRAGIPMDSTNKWSLLAHVHPKPHRAVANWIWHSGFDPNYDAGIPLLTHAVIYGNRALLEMLLRRGANVNVKTGSGDTALGWAIRTDFCEFDVAGWLLDAGADVNAPSKGFGYPLAFASSQVRPQLVKRLLALGANVRATDADGQTALHRAIFPVRDPLTARLQEQVVLLLLDAGVDVQAKDKGGVTALDRAAEYGRTNVAQVLLANGTQLDVFTAAACGDTNFIAAALNRDPALIRATKPDGTTPLHWASRNGHEAVADLLLKRGADANAKDHAEQTPLWLAVARNHPGTVTVLAKGGADVNMSAWNNFKPIRWAVECGHVAVTKQLIAHGADRTLLDGNGRTLLHLAASQPHKAMAELLLEKGLDPNAEFEWGTPLHVAAQAGRLEIVRLLLAHGAKVALKNRLGRTPLEVAVETKHEEVADLLRQHEAAK